jgi:hypothetical protein
MYSTSNHQMYSGNLTAFKDWGKSISDAILAAGWTKTADTGQVNWTTIASVPTSSGAYEIWAMADSLQSTFPVYMRLDYWNSGNNTCVQPILGTGTSGTGNLTGPTPAFQIVGATNVGDGSTWACHYSGDPSSFRFCLGTNSSYSSYFAVERSKDPTGANTNKFAVVMGMYQSRPRMQILPRPALGLPDQNVQSYWPFPDNYLTSAAFGNEITLFPIIPCLGIIGAPVIGTVVAKAADFANLTQISAAAFGGTHNYLMINPPSSPFANMQNQAGGVNCIGMLYE